ncbi:hypothetical protein [Streptomyces canus]|uniref:hypothetical protein n=1 Tax=Streptomyces canus TaxID=58343 RepID=UPI0036E629CB
MPVKRFWRTWRSNAIATDTGATPTPVYLAASHDELWARIRKRNEFYANDPNSIYFSESDLQRYRTRFVPPQEDEPHLPYVSNGVRTQVGRVASREVVYGFDLIRGFAPASGWCPRR